MRIRQALPYPTLLLASLSHGPVMAQFVPECGGPHTLVAPDAAEGDFFGVAVAADGDTVVVGAHYDDGPAGVNQGSASVFRWDGASWIFEAMLTASDASMGDEFGFSVTISGDTIAVGSYFDDELANLQQGSVYVFTRVGSNWELQARLTSCDGASDDQFGGAVALSGDTLIVGARSDDGPAGGGQGSAYIFTRSMVTWTEQAKIVASDAAANDWFGWSVAASNDTVIVGAPFEDGSAGASQGSAYVFIREGTLWTEQAKLRPGDPAQVDFFGWSVALATDLAIAGAPRKNSMTGAAYVFTRTTGTWSQRVKLTASDGGTVDQFGTSVAISAELAVVGAQENNNLRGAGYVFEPEGSAWYQQTKLTASDAWNGDVFGTAVSLSNQAVAIGGPRASRGGSFQHGLAWVYHRNAGIWHLLGDANASAVADFSDVLGVLAAFGANHSPGTGSGDANGDGVADFTDILTVLANFGAACP